MPAGAKKPLNPPGGDHYSVIFDDDVAESIFKFTGVLSA
jgi:hypothetical protein